MIRRYASLIGAGAAVLSVAVGSATAQVASPGLGKEVSLGGGGELDVPSRDPHIAYDLNLSAEHVWLRTPRRAGADRKLGLVVFISPEDRTEEVPAGWDAVLERNHLIFAAVQGAGNDQPMDRRYGLAVAAARRIAGVIPLDLARVYAAGLSGGARVAGGLGFYQPDVFHGTIQCCGADFPHPVAQAAPRDAEHAADAEYGKMEATDAEVAAAKAKVRFALITGSRDFRHGFIVDLFHGGFEKEGFQATLIDVPGMPHAMPAGPRFQEALDFIERRQPTTPDAAAASPPPAPAAWSAKPTDQWPQLLWENSFKSADTQFDGASAFLMRLPTGQTVGVTARHVFGDSFDPSTLDKPTTVWAVSPHGKPRSRVRLRHVAWDVDQQAGGKPLDCVMMLAEVQAHYPAEVLTPRRTPPVVGETVYLLGVPYGDKALQHVYKGTVIRETDGEAMFGYEVEGTPETRGFSGAPIVDATGLVLGIHHGKYNEQRNAGHVQAAGVDITVVLAAARPPAGSAPKAAPSLSHAAARPAIGERDTAAARALSSAQMYVTAKRYDVARTRLQAVIDTYPGTAAAKSAQQQLSSLPQN